ncbi:MAG: PAS domain-containing sensor histidine kinase [Candidatus Paceibacterota bacterium]|jgi:PAS domain S-box-containing protein
MDKIAKKFNVLNFILSLFFVLALTNFFVINYFLDSEKEIRINFILLIVNMIVFGLGAYVVISITRKIEESRVKNEAILESVGDGLIAVDNERKIIVINKVAINMLGWEGKDLVGKEPNHLALEDENGKLIPLDKRPTAIALATGKITKGNYFFIRKDKTRFPVAITATPIFLNEKLIGLIKMIRDITYEKEIDKIKTEFVSIVSHQLRGPLSSTKLYTEMILNGDAGEVPPKQKKFLEEIYRGNQWMIEMVNTLLDVSRIELGIFKIEPKPTDLVDLAHNVLREQELKIKDKKLAIIESFENNIPIFSTDPKLLHMVFQNLLSNAVEYTPTGGKIELAISFDGKNTLSIKFSDNGYGIPAKQQSQIFSKLFRADNVKYKGIEGTGLGLYIVKSIIENLNGKIWFESEEDKGTTFFITLPLDGANKEKVK